MPIGIQAAVTELIRRKKGEENMEMEGRHIRGIGGTRRRCLCG